MGRKEAAVEDVSDAQNVPVEQSMVELEALEPRDVLPDAEVPDAVAETTGDDEEPPLPAEDETDWSAEQALDAVFGDGDADEDADPAPDDVPEQVPEVDAPAAAPASSVLVPAAPVAPAAVAMPQVEVQTFLTDLRETLVELARQPAPSNAPAIDLEPLVTTVREGFTRSQHELAQTNVAIGSLVQCVGDLGKRLNHQLSPTAARGGAVAIASPRLATTARNSTWVLVAACLLIMSWSAMLWWKTGNVRLSIGTLLGANAVACCLLAGRRAE